MKDRWRKNRGGRDTADKEVYIQTDIRYQFHQRFMHEIFVQKFIQSQNVPRKKAFVCKIRAFNIDEIDT